MEFKSKNSSDNESHRYGDDEMLMLSGIQHYRFCPRQWALAYVEQQWQDNHLTILGNQLHRKVDDPLTMDCSRGVVHLRSVALVSRSLGVSGIADVLELTPATDDANAIRVPKYDGLWHATPIEYKHGRPKSDASDDAQLCAQAICLEEMYGIRLTYGEIYYERTRHRKAVELTDDLRALVCNLVAEMHELYATGTTPSARWTSKCKSCSLKDLCMVGDLRRATSVQHYLNQLTIDEETT